MTRREFLVGLPWLVVPSLGAAEDRSTDPGRVFGKIQFVDAFPDVKVKVVQSFADLDVKIVEAFADRPGLWQIVTSFPDFKVQMVDSFPDFTIRFVKSFPGVR